MFNDRVWKMIYKIYTLHVESSKKEIQKSVKEGEHFRSLG